MIIYSNKIRNKLLLSDFTDKYPFKIIQRRLEFETDSPEFEEYINSINNIYVTQEEYDFIKSIPNNIEELLIIDNNIDELNKRSIKF